MRGLGGISLLLLAILAGLIWAVTWGPWRGVSLIRPQANNLVRPAISPPRPATNSPSQPKGPHGPSPAPATGPTGSATVLAAGAEQVPEGSVRPPAPTPPVKFPTAVEVPLGTLGSALVDSFGPPVAQTLAVDERGRTEIFIYRRARPDTATVVQVRNGRVVSAVTTAY